MVRPRRLELPRLAALAPQAGASTNSATAAPDSTGRGIPNRPPSGKATRLAALQPIAPASRNADFARMSKVEWRISDGAVPYAEALAAMEARVADIRAGPERELVWLLEHPPVYTAGTSAKAQDLLQPLRFPVHVARRGGQHTYHGPRQRLVYAILDLRAPRPHPPRF